MVSARAGIWTLQCAAPQEVLAPIAFEFTYWWAKKKNILDINHICNHLISILM